MHGTCCHFSFINNPSVRAKELCYSPNWMAITALNLCVSSTWKQVQYLRSVYYNVLQLTCYLVKFPLWCFQYCTLDRDPTLVPEVYFYYFHPILMSLVFANENMWTLVLGRVWRFCYSVIYMYCFINFCWVWCLLHLVVDGCLNVQTFFIYKIYSSKYCYVCVLF